MSTENAAWLYNMTKRGDVVEYTGTDRPMTLDNGYGDWNARLRRASAAPPSADRLCRLPPPWVAAYRTRPPWVAAYRIRLPL